MTETQQQILLHFHQQQSTLLLSTLDKAGIPGSSYAPFIANDLFTYFIFVSQLAPHTANLLHHPVISIMLLEDQARAKNIYARKRFTLTCTATPVAREDLIWKDIMNQFEQRHGPVLRVLRSLADFQLFCLQATQGRWVSGFGKAFLVEQTPFLIRELNNDDPTQSTTE